jgi:hypothetical protein
LGSDGFETPVWQTSNALILMTEKASLGAWKQGRPVAGFVRHLTMLHEVSAVHVTSD